MPENSKPRSGTEPDLRRERAYREEAEALREDLAQYLREGAVGDEVKGTLAEILRSELPGLVQAALRDESFRASLRREIASAVLPGLEAELKARQRSPLEESVLRSTDAHPPAAGGHAAAARSWWSQGVPIWTLVALGAVLVLVLGGGWWLRERLRSEPPPTVAAAETAPPLAPVAKPEPAASRAASAAEAAASASPAPADPQALKQTWLDLVRRHQPPAGSTLARLLRAHPADRAFDCWFGGATSGKLSGVLGDVAVASLDEGIVRQRIAGAFSPCVADYAVRAGSPSLVVFGAQLTAAELFSRPAEGRPAGCRDAPTAAVTTADGKSGGATETLLNALERCNGGVNLPRLDARAGPRGYLVALFIGLDQLQRASARPAAP